MAWVPVVGSAFGSLLGGFLSDLMMQRMHGTQSSSRIDALGDDNDNDDDGNNAVGGEDDSSRPYAMVMGLEGGSSHSRCRGGSGDIDIDQRINSRFSNNETSISGPPVNHLIGEDNTITIDDDMSGGILSPSSSPPPSPQAMRMLITGCSNLLALPLIVYALQLDFPYCFLILIASGMVS